MKSEKENSNMDVQIKVILRVLGMLSIALMVSCSANQSRQSTKGSGITLGSDFGVLVMAHGSSSEWNKGVEESLHSLRESFPVELAFGMADAGSMESAVRRLEAQGVRHAAVVRLFISGESWYERTLQILGVSDGAPPKSESNYLSLNPGMPIGYWKIETDVAFHVNKEGLAEAEEMDKVLLSRVRDMSFNPSSEVVAVIAHGPEDDEENSRWIAEIEKRTTLLEHQLGIKEIEVFTLREDWEVKRVGAEGKIRGFIERANQSNLQAIVVPYRVQGFGPYDSVLEGLEYKADRAGLVPHENVSLWIEGQVKELLWEVEEHRIQIAATSD
jgi:hypothetical protein